jgi:hypothetical protein
MTHLTRGTQEFDRAAEVVRSNRPKADFLISTMKKVVLKSLSGVNMSKEVCPEILLSPKPILAKCVCACLQLNIITNTQTLLAFITED